MANLCGKCNSINPPGFRFCGYCGAPLPAVTPRAAASESTPTSAPAMPDTIAQKISSMGKQIEGERRNVTVLFADLSGYTAIAEKLDPEEVYNLINSALQAFIDEIYKHEGTIDKVMGDGVIALFGAPIAHEDDPARALRAALGMQAALRRLNIDLAPRLGAPLRMRIGLNVGTVVVGQIGSDLHMEYTALGDTVNVASRVQSVAEPDTILCSRAVYAQTQALFEFHELGAIRVKNRVEPVEIFEVLAPRVIAGRVRGIPGLSAPMVGREIEFALVRDAVDELVAHRAGKIVLVTGNAGIGKSRLTSELKRYLQDKWNLILEGACVSYGQSAYGVFLDLLRRLFDIADKDREEIIREKIERTVNDLMPAASAREVLPYIEHLFSLRIYEKEMVARIKHLTPPQLQQQTFIAIRELLVAQAQIQPLILIFEDIHWIDATSLELLTLLLGSVEDAPLLLYCNSRLAEGAAAPQIERLGKTMYAQHFLPITLAPLSTADSVALIDLLLTIHELPESLRQLIPERAAGNPFYLEEIIRMLIDRGVIRRVNDRWEMTPNADLENFQVPATLQGLIMARIDSLSEDARQTIQCAAVIGPIFLLRLLQAVIENPRGLPDTLAELEEHQIISRTASNGDVEYHFNHVLVRDTVYHSLLHRRREYLHRKIAQSIEALFKDRLDEHLEALAYHYAESGDADNALPYAIRAGRYAAERFANDQALQHYKRAADLLTRTQATAQQKIDTFTGLASVQTFTGDYAAAATSYLSALEFVRSLAKSIDAVRQSAEIMRSLGRVSERRGDYAEALHWLENALRELEQDPNPKSVERVRLYNDIGWVQYRRGEFDHAYNWRMKTLQIVEGSEHYSEMASAYNGLVALFNRKGDWQRANAYAEKGLRLRERIGDLQGMSQSYTNMGVIAWEQGDWAQTLNYLRRSLDIKQKIGDIQGIALLNNNLCELYSDLGDFAQANTFGAKALSIAEKIRHNSHLCQALNNLARVQIAQEQYPTALNFLTRSLEINKEMRSKELIAEAEWLCAEAYLGMHQIDQAQQSAERAAALAREIGRQLIEAKAQRALAQIAYRQREWRAAQDAIDTSCAILTALKNPFELAKSELESALIQRAQGNYGIAQDKLRRAIETFTRLGAQTEKIRAQSELEQLRRSYEA